MTSVDALLPYAKLYTWVATRGNQGPCPDQIPTSRENYVGPAASLTATSFASTTTYYYLIQWQCTNTMAKPQAVRTLFHAHTTIVRVCWHTVTQADNAMAGEGMGSAIGQRTRGHCAPAMCVSRSEPLTARPAFTLLVIQSILDDFQSPPELNQTVSSSLQTT